MKIKDRVIIVCVIGLLVLMLYILDIGCLVKLFTGFSCPACGITRAWISILQGDFTKAFYYHPLFIYAPFVVLTIAFEDKLPKKALSIFWGIAGVLFIGCYIYRIVNGSEILTFDFSSGIIGRSIFQMWEWIKLLFGIIKN